MGEGQAAYDDFWANVIETSSTHQLSWTELNADCVIGYSTSVEILFLNCDLSRENQREKQQTQVFTISRLILPFTNT